jgi:hypothetical protein
MMTTIFLLWIAQPDPMMTQNLRIARHHCSAEPTYPTTMTIVVALLRPLCFTHPRLHLLSRWRESQYDPSENSNNLLFPDCKRIGSPRNHNATSQQETSSRTTRTRKSPNCFGYYSALDIPEDFEILMLDYTASIWNDDPQSFE